MEKITCAILGYGNRGSVYGKRLSAADGVEIVAVCDPDRENLLAAKQLFSLDDKSSFSSDDEFFKEKRADVLVVASMDKDHYKHTARAIALGYDILLEKPIALSTKECLSLKKLAEQSNVKVVVCHVLRYTDFFTKIKELSRRPEFGRVLSISESENINFVHYWLSFLHGNWHNSKKSSPIILQKCSHDFDLICWIAGAGCQRVSSFAELNVYKKENAPEGSTQHCCDCPHKFDCVYSGIRIMTKQPAWLKEYFPDMDMSQAGVEAVLGDRLNRFAKCAFKEDNDVMTNQVVNMHFTNGVVAQHFMSGFSAEGCREIKIHSDKGEIRGLMGENKNVISYQLFQEEAETICVDAPDNGETHGGGDNNIIEDFIEYVRTGNKKENITLLSESIMSHRIAFAAEKSRQKNGESINL